MKAGHAAAMFSLAFVLIQPSPIERAMELRSPAFDDGGAIPQRYTCDGADISPPLRWQDLPTGTQSLVLIVDDPDAPDPRSPRMTWVHWVLTDIPPSVTELQEGITTDKLPTGVREGLNDWKRTGYGGPCPPVGRHRYFFKLYALDTVLALSRPTKAQAEEAMQGHILAHAVLMGTYERSHR